MGLQSRENILVGKIFRNTRKNFQIKPLAETTYKKTLVILLNLQTLQMCSLSAPLCIARGLAVT